MPVRPAEFEEPKAPGALATLARRHPLTVDALVAIAYLALSAFGVSSVYLATGTGRPLAVDLTLAVGLVGSSAALLVRRTRPWATFVVMWLAAGSAVTVDPGLDPVGISLALYALAVHRSNRSAWIGLAASVAAAPVVVAATSALRRWLQDVGGLDGGGGLERTPALVNPVFILLTLVAVLIGVVVGGRRRYVAALVDRSERLVREQQQREQLAVASERARITREMHDIVAHGISVMVSLADGADAIAEKDPMRSRQALGRIATTGRGSLDEMRRLLGALGADDGGPGDERRPAPGVAQLPELIASYRAAGLPVVLDSSGEPPISEGVQTVVYRIVQEALTNSLRHAASAEEARVVISYGTTVAITVTDDGHSRGGAAAGAESGRGLVGMRERARLFDGDVEAGALPEGGWRVAVRLRTDGARR